MEVLVVIRLYNPMQALNPKTYKNGLDIFFLLNIHCNLFNINWQFSKLTIYTVWTCREAEVGVPSPFFFAAIYILKFTFVHIRSFVYKNFFSLQSNCMLTNNSTSNIFFLLRYGPLLQWYMHLNWVKRVSQGCVIIYIIVRIYNFDFFYWHIKIARGIHYLIKINLILSK